MTVGVPALAAGFASQFDTIGPYVGFGSLIAVIAMAVLVFSQGRELQRLREWAGTAPERLEALEERLEQEQARPAAPARPGVPGVAAPGKLAPHPGAQAPPAPATAQAPTPDAAPAGAAPPPPGTAAPGSPPPLAAGVAATAAAKGQGPTPPRPVPPAGASQATRVVPAVSGTPRASTPVGRANAARQREAPEPPKRSIGQLIGVGLVGVVVLVGVLFAIGVIGGDNTSPVADDNERDQPAPVSERPKSKSYSPGQTTVVVLNATGQGGLAKTGSDLLDNKRFATGAVGDYSENGVRSFKESSTVAYRSGRGNREAAQDIAKHLGLRSTAVRPMSGTIRAAVDGTPKIVVVLGQDYASKTGTTPADSNPTGTTPNGTTSDAAPSTGTGSTGSTGGTGGTADGTAGSTGSTPDSSITGDVSGDVTGDVVADTTIGAP